MRAGQRLVDGVLQAHVDAPDGAGQVVEAEQVDLGVVVDGDAGEPFDGPDQRGPARLRGLGVDPRAVPDPVSDQPLGGQGLHRGVSGIDLVLPVAGDVDVAVARDRERDGRPAALGDVQQDDRVRVEHARVVAAGVQLFEHLLWQRVALRVGAAVDADEQDVLRPAVAARGDDVRRDDPARQVPVQPPRRAVDEEDERGRGDGGQPQPPQQGARPGRRRVGGTGAAAPGEPRRRGRRIRGAARWAAARRGALRPGRGAARRPSRVGRTPSLRRFPDRTSRRRD